MPSLSRAIAGRAGAVGLTADSRLKTPASRLLSKDFFGRALAAFDGAVHCADVAGAGRFAGEKEDSVN